MRFLIHVGRAYPSRTLLIFVALLVAGLVQAISLSTLLPLVSVAMEQDGAGQATGGTLMAEVLQDIGVAPTLGVLLSLLVIGMALKSVFMLLANSYVGYTVAQIATDLRLRLLRALVEARWSYFLRQPAGNLTNAIANEPKRASGAYLNGTRTFALSFETMVYVGVALTVSWKATLIALAVGIVIMAAFGHLVRAARRAGKKQTDRMKSLVRLMTDTLQSVKPLKAMGLTDRASTVLASETVRLNKALRREVFSTEALSALYEPFIVALVAVGLYFALTKMDIPLANTLVLVLLLVRVLGSLGKVQRSHQKMGVAESAYWSLLGTIEETEQAHECAGNDLQPVLQREIALREIRFGFGDNEVLKGLTLSLPVGSFTTLIGASGSGKTTMVDLITGMLSPASGEVLIDDTPLQQCNLDQWRHMIGYVPQETLLLNDTVVHNVTLGDPNLNEADAEHALRAAEAWEFVEAMPEGMQTIVGERGGNLSGGQQQRLCIARALVRRPQLLILDEATSALDPNSEAAVCRALTGLRGQMTILAVSHQTRLADIADRVLRLQNGRWSARPSPVPTLLPKKIGKQEPLPGHQTRRPAALARGDTKSVGFLFNHYAAHQVPHAAPYAFELSKRHPEFNVIIACSTNQEMRFAREIATLYPEHRCVFKQLRPSRYYKAIDPLVSKWSFKRKKMVLSNNLDFFRTLDALVAPERQCMKLRTHYGLTDLTMIHARHGAGDRKGGFDDRSGAFDLTLLPGQKYVDRLTELGYLREGAYASVGWPKFEVVRGLGRGNIRLFNNSNPIVVYNPHFDQRVSSWAPMGLEVLDFFLENPDYNLIFAPHVVLFKRNARHKASLPTKYLEAPNIFIDKGSPASADMSYMLAADIYLGDVSSQVYEFLLEPRPCVYLNGHQAAWWDDPNYFHWTLGQVVSEVRTELRTALDRAFERQDQFLTPQREAFAYTFRTESDTTAAERGADAIAEFLRAKAETDHLSQLAA